ncbi:MAG: 5-oxoprolinase subunit PxpB [Chloroflexota bacterium]|nr:5-oxoprolinase subunit PxpB [Chloroflexota bacterium]
MIRQFGEGAILVDGLGSAEAAQALAASIRADPPPGVLEAVPGLSSLLVELNPLTAEQERITAELERRMARPARRSAPARLHTIAVTYDGPDLDEVAALCGLASRDVVELHASVELRVLFCGFAPGFAYLGELPPVLRVDRLATPRTRTPAGSVAIAGSMSAIYPVELPGGWRVIGHAEISLFDPRQDPPALLLPGDHVRFEPA